MDGTDKVATLATGGHAAFAETGFGKFFGKAYAEKKVKNEIQPRLQKG